MKEKENNLKREKKAMVTYKEMANRAEIKLQVVLSPLAAPSSIINRQESEQA